MGPLTFFRIGNHVSDGRQAGSDAQYHGDISQ
jgi:hypothetical protein